MPKSVGIVECNCLSDVAAAADRVAKAAPVRLLGLREIGSNVSLTIEGETADVERALKAAQHAGTLFTSLAVKLIPEVHADVLHLLYRWAAQSSMHRPVRHMPRDGSAGRAR